MKIDKGYWVFLEMRNYLQLKSIGRYGQQILDKKYG